MYEEELQGQRELQGLPMTTADAVIAVTTLAHRDWDQSDPSLAKGMNEYLQSVAPRRDLCESGAR